MVLDEAGVNIPNFTTHRADAQRWLENDECKVMCRTILNGHSGKGIVVAREVEELVDAPLYTEYIKKTHEFRVHVFNGNVIDYVQKKKRAGVEERNKYVRSVENGWVFCREDIEVREDVKAIAIDAVLALGLDFGAVDVILGHDGNVYVLEVNTAIGMEGTTVECYKNAFQEFLNEL
jgi:D-alanine-D-alanine ligase-like ATP-grasp enzyme